MSLETCLSFFKKVVSYFIFTRIKKITDIFNNIINRYELFINQNMKRML